MYTLQGTTYMSQEHILYSISTVYVPRVHFLCPLSDIQCTLWTWTVLHLVHNLYSCDIGCSRITWNFHFWYLKLYSVDLYCLHGTLNFDEFSLPSHFLNFFYIFNSCTLLACLFNCFSCEIIVCFFGQNFFIFIPHPKFFITFDYAIKTFDAVRLISSFSAPSPVT